ncbi:hypothetical protein [Microbacterium sp. MTN4-26]|uniref:hypothetical protein n=1 Tax=unclassified Microbacterium TaxID=2609290 RepID=UPI0036F43C8F
MLAIGSPVTLPDGTPGRILGVDRKAYTIHTDGADPNIQVFAVLLESGEVRHFTRDSLAAFGSDEEIRRSGSLK